MYNVPSGKSSYPFRIAEDIYDVSLYHAVRTFYYQRCGTAVTEQHGGKWNHTTCHKHSNQDTEAHLWAGYDAGQPKDASGGWFDVLVLQLTDKPQARCW
jgi:endoglucanase